MFIRPFCRVGNLVREGSRGKNLGKQRIGIKRYSGY